MTNTASATFTRRTLLALGAGLVAAPAAMAAPALSFPLRLAYARVGASGFVPVKSAEQDVWSALRLRTGGLIEEILPLPVGGMLGLPPPEADGGAGCALAARRIAMEAGYTRILLYAAASGRPAGPPKDMYWLDKVFATIRVDLSLSNSAAAELHLLDVEGGRPLLSVTADAPPRTPIVLIEPHAAKERKVLEGVALAFERRLQDAARPLYAGQRSIAD